jgi:geranylgeranyl reductase family protein
MNESSSETMPQHNKYGCIIIGAGPAGLSAGRELLKGGCRDVLLLDKKAPWDHIIPCAEGVGRLGFKETGAIKPAWIRQEVNSAVFHAPGGSKVHYTDRYGGYIIDRARMQRDIAQELIAGGLHTDFDCTIKSITPAVPGADRSVTCADGSTISAQIVIDASGPTNCFGKRERIAAKPLDLEPSYFVWAEGVDIPPDHIHIFAGQKIAPGGYAWVFPRGAGGANIGIVLGRSFVTSTDLRSLLDAFITANYPSVKVMRRFAGSIPCGYRRSLPIALPGFIKAGDAASTVNPISRAGISEALLSGMLAGEAALAMLNAKNVKEQVRAAKTYERNWNLRRGDRHQKLAKVKNALLSVPDSDYNRGAETLSGIPQSEMTMSKIFRASLSRFPRLVWAMRHLM